MNIGRIGHASLFGTEQGPDTSTAPGSSIASALLNAVQRIGVAVGIAALSTISVITPPQHQNQQARPKRQP